MIYVNAICLTEVDTILPIFSERRPNLWWSPQTSPDVTIEYDSTHARCIVEIYRKRAFMTYAGVFIPFILRPQTLHDVWLSLGLCVLSFYLACSSFVGFFVVAEREPQRATGTILPNELPSKDGRALGEELGEDQECWPGGSDGHMFVSGVNRGADLSASVRAPIPT